MDEEIWGECGRNMGQECGRNMRQECGRNMREHGRDMEVSMGGVWEKYRRVRERYELSMG